MFHFAATNPATATAHASANTTITITRIIIIIIITGTIISIVSITTMFAFFLSLTRCALFHHNAGDSPRPFITSSCHHEIQVRKATSTNERLGRGQ